jgi:hypothetical protein
MFIYYEWNMGNTVPLFKLLEHSQISAASFTNQSIWHNLASLEASLKYMQHFALSE